ncbi:hypothetical protein M8818_002870 [Zalaria obscura]|uniref:Uncharacterized protein n=1 Tax=Zalaria obscura TaxID=2024903 RepID=A0ACC3SHJ0_9PEZI
MTCGQGSAYDCCGPCLNAIPILNPAVFDEAAASDARRAAGQTRGPLEGIPYTIKDSMMYAGMTCASGSPALTEFVAKEDCFVASQLRQAGCVCIGRTNTPPMMASGMHRGAYGRAESPYNLDYLTAAFSSGSSNGSATSTAASFAAFGLGSETVSSGRSPASNNGLVAYTPSRGVISARGIWPLYPTCDVLVPHTRTMEDMMIILDTITATDPENTENFWLEQPFVKIDRPSLPHSFVSLLSGSETSLRGKTIGVPKMYIGKHDPEAQPTVVSPDVVEVWQQARRDLEALGATVVETDFPLVTNYDFNPSTGLTNNVLGFPDDWNSIERSTLVAYSWDDFLLKHAPDTHDGLRTVDGTQLFPRPPNYLPDKYAETKNYMDYPALVELAKKRDRTHDTIFSIPGMPAALPALEAQRKRDLDAWMAALNLDVVVFPAAGDVGRADLDKNDASARHALQTGVKYSNGGRAIRHMGVPTVSVAMGVLATSRMPINLTFVGKSGQDTDLMRYAYAFEQKTRRRVPPPLTPALEAEDSHSKDLDTGETAGEGRGKGNVETASIAITNAKTSPDGNKISVTGTLAGPADPERPNAELEVEVYIDGTKLHPLQVHREKEHDGAWTAEGTYTPFSPPKPLYGGVGRVVGNVVVVALVRRSGRGRGRGRAVAGALELVPQAA